MEDEEGQEQQPPKETKEEPSTSKSKSVKTLASTHRARSYSESSAYPPSSSDRSSEPAERERHTLMRIRPNKRMLLRAKVRKRFSSKGRREGRKVMKAKARRRPAQHRRRRARNNPSTYTIFTAVSSTPSANKIQQACKFCGHGCCRRRCQRARGKPGRRKAAKAAPKRRKCVAHRKTFKKMISGGYFPPGLVAIQAFSSKKCLPKQEKKPAPPTMYSKIQPNMIKDAMEALSMWKESIRTEDIMAYILNNHPVNPEYCHSYPELQKELNIAAVLGLVEKVGEDLWSVPGFLKVRRLSTTHVTDFWTVHWDRLMTLPPPERSCPPPEPQPPEEDPEHCAGYSGYFS